MARRHSRIVLVLLATLHLAAVVLLAPPLELVDHGSLAGNMHLAGSGLIITAPPVLALWAVLGRQRASIRLPLACWLSAAIFLTAAYGECRNYGQGGGLILLASIAWSTASIVHLLALGLLRALRGWRLELEDVSKAHFGSGTSGDVRREHRWQFSMRTLLAWSFGIAFLCAGARWLAPYASDTIDSWPANLLTGSLKDSAIIGLLVALAGLPVLSVAWLLLADGERVGLRSTLAVITAGGVASGTVVCESWNPVMGRLVLLSEEGVLAAAAFALAIVRACSFRLVRRSRAVLADDAPLDAPTCRARFACLLCVLGVVALVLAAYAPQRFEIWRRGDQTRALVALGWKLDFDNRGLIITAACPATTTCGAANSRSRRSMT